MHNERAQNTPHGRNYSGFPFARKSAAIIRISPLTVRILCNRQNSSVRHSQYAQIQSLWTGSEVCKFVKSSEIVSICPLAVDILWNFWYCDGVRKVVPTLGKQVIPDGLMCSAMYPSPSACRRLLSPLGFMSLCMEPVAKVRPISILFPQQVG